MGRHHYHKIMPLPISGLQVLQVWTSHGACVAHSLIRCGGKFMRRARRRKRRRDIARCYDARRTVTHFWTSFLTRTAGISSSLAITRS